MCPNVRFVVVLAVLTSERPGVKLNLGRWPLVPRCWISPKAALGMRSISPVEWPASKNQLTDGRNSSWERRKFTPALPFVNTNIFGKCPDTRSKTPAQCVIWPARLSPSQSLATCTAAFVWIDVEVKRNSRWQRLLLMTCCKQVLFATVEPRTEDVRSEQNLAARSRPQVSHGYHRGSNRA